jgi:hypothetical protein
VADTFLSRNKSNKGLVFLERLDIARIDCTNGGNVFTADWKFIGFRTSLSSRIAQVTGIEQDILQAAISTSSTHLVLLRNSVGPVRGRQPAGKIEHIP